MTTRARTFSDVSWRFIAALIVGTGAGFVVAQPLGLAAALISGWGVAAVVEVVWVLVFTWRMDAKQTRAHATREDPGRRISRIVSIVGSVASLGAVAVVLFQTKSAPIGEAVALGFISILGVAASWLLIQTNYMLRYAHIYFDEPVGGIDFHGGASEDGLARGGDPMYTDFIYFSVGLGMTYQVADTNVSSNAIRRVVIGQTMLAWIFATVIIATVINLVAGIGPPTPAP